MLCLKHSHRIGSMRQNLTRALRCIASLLLFVGGAPMLRAQNPAAPQSVSGAAGYSIEQLTFGPRHHFFGYIGHASTIPWNAST